MSDRTRECLRACLACHDACLRAASYLQASEAAVALVRLLFNTADIVKTTASLLRSDLDVAEHAGRACVGVCERTARSCDSAPDDATLRACSEACRSCAQAWQLMARAGAMAATRELEGAGDQDVPRPPRSVRRAPAPAAASRSPPARRPAESGHSEREEKR